MGFKEHKDKLIFLLSEDVNVSIFLGSRVRHVREVVKEVIEDLEKRMSNNVNEVPESLKVKVERLNKDLIVLTVVNIVEDSTREFLDSYSLLTYNWGSAIKDEEIKRTSRGIKTMLDFHKSTVGLISAARTFVRYAKQFESFSPSAFNISKAYLEQLYDDLKKGKNINNRNK